MASSFPAISLKGALVVYFTLFTGISFISFTPDIKLPLIVGHSLLFLYFLVALALGIVSSYQTVHFLLLLLTPLLPVLIVIDPVEVGLYGYDPYASTLPTARAFVGSSSMASLMNTMGAWPGFYSLYHVTKAVTGTGWIVTAKYIPLLSLGIPALFYVGANRVVSTDLAYIAALGLSGVKTLYLFEIKFVEETIAAVYFFLLFYFAVRSDARWKRSLLGVIMIFAVVLSHPGVALFSTLLLGALFLTPVLASILPTRLRPTRGRELSPLLFLLAGIGLIVTLVYFGVDFTGRLSAMSLIFNSNTGSTGAIVILNRIFVNILFKALLGGFALFLIAVYLSERRFTGWQLPLSVYSAAMMGFFLLFTYINAPLDPSRPVLYFVPILLLTTLSVLADIPPEKRGWRSSPIVLVLALLILQLNVTLLKNPWIIVVLIFLLMIVGSYLLVDHPVWDRGRQVIPVVLTIALVLTQLSAIPAHVVYSDPGKTDIAEGHYSPSQFAASEWADSYATGTIIGHEKGLWVSQNNPYVAPEFADCSGSIFVNRSGGGDLAPRRADTFFNNGDLQLSRCTR